MALGHDEEAAEVAGKSLSLRPHAATAFNLGDALIRLKRWTEAIGPLREALTLEPRNDDTRVMLATALTGAGQYDQADEVLRDVSDTVVNGRSLVLLSHIHQKRGRTLEAIEAARAALRANPTLPQAYLGLGFALLLGGHHSEALEAFGEAQRLDPSDVSAELGTGASLTALGEHQAASAAFAAHSAENRTPSRTIPRSSRSSPRTRDSRAEAGDRDVLCLDDGRIEYEVGPRLKSFGAHDILERLAQRWWF
jgi:tetratricopeptide (TPR) repeat protein